MMLKYIKVIVILVITYMVVAPFLYQSESEFEISDGHIKDKKIETPKEKAVHNVLLPDFASIKDPKAKKRAFFNYLKPAIDKENAKLIRIRNQLLSLQKTYLVSQEISSSKQAWLNDLSKIYSVGKKLTTAEQLNILLSRVDAIPRELVLVQAANESAWGSSRFARIGLNFFGMWCFQKGCGIVPNGRDSGLTHEVAAFKSVDEMVNRYFLNINTNSAYSLFRTIRLQLRENNIELKADILATGLLPYSERGMDYIVEINTMLRHNWEYIKA